MARWCFQKSINGATKMSTKKQITYEGKQNFCVTSKTKDKKIWQKDVSNIFIHNRNNKKEDTFRYKSLQPFQFQ
jgi:hypothetical protein